MSLFERLTKKAQLHPQRLVLPESKEPRTLQAAERILADKIAEIIFLGKKEEVLAEAEKLGLKHIAEARSITRTTLPSLRSMLSYSAN